MRSKSSVWKTEEWKRRATGRDPSRRLHRESSHSPVTTGRLLTGVSREELAPFITCKDHFAAVENGWWWEQQKYLSYCVSSVTRRASIGLAS
jgi:hypothetical protein